MKANELRLGNLIRFNNYIQPESIVTVNARFFSSLAGGRSTDQIKNDEGINNYYSGIPLTPEILVKAGFEEMDLGIFESNKYDIYLYYSKGANGFLFKSRPDGGIILKHLHQLQNLYFALTGKELTFDL